MTGRMLRRKQQLYSSPRRHVSAQRTPIGNSLHSKEKGGTLKVTSVPIVLFQLVGAALAIAVLNHSGLDRRKRPQRLYCAGDRSRRLDRVKKVVKRPPAKAASGAGIQATLADHQQQTNGTSRIFRQPCEARHILDWRAKPGFSPCCPRPERPRASARPHLMLSLFL